nr:hypothetical protein BaRGS_004278 [Batillaria attramentaria]
MTYHLSDFADCPASDLLTSYVRYSYSAIAFNYIDFTNGLTEDECMESCSSTDWCRTVEKLAGKFVHQ